MKFKKSLLIIFLFICLFAMASVSASDANDTAMTATEDNLEIDQSTDDVIGVEENMELASSGTNEVLKADEQTFAQLNTTINGNADNDIYLESDYKYSDGDDSFKNGIVIDRDVNIYGNGHTINGSCEARIFKINSGKVVFYDITFVNGNATGEREKGGAINGNCRAIDCTFKENYADYGGGAIEGGSAVNCIFISNHAYGEYTHGGAMSNGSALNCSFIGNSADSEFSQGGAIFSVSAVNCTFTGNSANSGGAAFESSAVNCTFSDNVARHGAAICSGYKMDCSGQNDFSYTEDLILHFDADDFTTIYGSGETLPIKLRNQNTNQNTNLVDLIDYDVVIYDEAGVVRTYHCLSNDDLSFDLPLGTYTAELIVTYPSLSNTERKNITLSITTDGTTFWDLNKTINGNDAVEITLDKDYAFNQTTDSDFTNGIVINRDLTIYGNGHTINGSDEARIFKIDGGNVVFYNITFVNGNATGENEYGGAINGNCRAIDCTFKENEAHYGGAVSEVSAVNCTFTGNTARNGVGGAMFNGSAVNCIFTGNTAPGAGAGAMCDSSAVNCTFTDNVASSGGAMIRGSAVNCTFSGNTASTGFGNAMNMGYKAGCSGQSPEDFYYTDELTLHFDANNFTTPCGSGETLPIKLRNQNNDLVAFIDYDVVIYDETGVVKTYHCLSNDDLSFDLLPGVYTAKLTVTDPGLTQAEQKNITLTITTVGTTFWDLNNLINNNTNDTITLDKDYAFNQTTDSAFIAGIEISRPVTIIGNNHSIDGKGQAGIFWVTGDNVNITNIIFVNGYDNFDAGAIYWEGANGAVSGSVFSSNRADHVGGAIVWRGANGTVSDSIFIGNKAGQDGGAIYWWAVNGTVLRSTFINNHADNNGGAVYWTEENGTVSDSIFINNTARRGVAVHATELLKADYCWFGGNATNYMDMPIGGEARCDYILFLNATANPNPVQLFSTSEVIFKLYLYNSGNISEYDNTRLPPFNLRITSTNGDVDTYMVTFGESITYTATGLGIGSVTADFMNVTASAILTVNKVKTVLTADAVTATYNTNKNLVITLKDDKGNALSGVKVTVDLNGAKTYTTDKNGQIKINVAKLVPKTYTAKITFNGDDIYDKSTSNVKVVVKKAKAKITAKKKTFKKSKKVKKYAITLKSGKNPIKKVKVTIKIGKKTFKAKTNAKGKATFKIKKLTKKGKYKAVVKFNGNKYYNKATKKVKITIK